jgi:hypothetical protein
MVCSLLQMARALHSTLLGIGGSTMKTRRFLLPGVILLLLLALGGCNKISPGQSAKALNPANTNQDSAAQPDANDSSPAAKAAADSSGGAASTSNSATSSTQAPETSTVPAGTPITVRLQQSLSSASAVPGERFEAVLDQPIEVDDRIVLPAGTPVAGHVIVVRHSGRLHHPGELGLTLDNIAVGQQQISLVTSSVVARGGSHKKRNWGWIGGGTGGGALIGALAAGGKGALIGSGIGAAAGTTTAFITGKKDVGFGAEHRLSFRLTYNLNVTA